MSDKSKNTKNRLLVAAGKLFAEFGFDRVTTRMIAEEAGIGLSAIHYHFDNKLDLYLGAFEYAHDKDNRINFFEIIEENPALVETREGQAEIIRTVVLRYFRNIFNPERDGWETQLLVREIVNPSSALPALARTFIESNVNHSEKFCKMVRPDISDADAAIWADTLFSHLFLYILAEKPIEAVRGKKWLNDTFFYSAARMISRFMILELDLPLPEDLKKR